MAILAVLLAAAGGLGSLVMAQKSGEKVSAVEVTQRVAAGEHIPSSALREIQVAKDTSVPFVRWEQRGQLAAKYFAASDIMPSTLLTGPMLTDQPGVTTNQAVVGLSLKSGQYPPGLREGDKVQVVAVGSSAMPAGAGGSATASPAPGGTTNGSQLASGSVRQVFKSDGSNSNLSLSVLVPAGTSGAIAQAASAGNVALVLLPSSSN
ncbi:hypothetical protein LN042_23240 [Kitasatospora sp. RB6PN24]|uniref:hypothetical protein n=1 Tax=Kitasatospora humi TaxID=2893891 RepID=UPI001E5EB2B3|nr:hypothetical protein [Kitasatospora humi]MCC9309952.1 hypothetical protein [Kitasatospora humi]